MHPVSVCGFSGIQDVNMGHREIFPAPFLSCHCVPGTVPGAEEPANTGQDPVGPVCMGHAVYMGVQIISKVRDGNKE